MRVSQILSVLAFSASALAAQQGGQFGKGGQFGQFGQFGKGTANTASSAQAAKASGSASNNAAATAASASTASTASAASANTGNNANAASANNALLLNPANVQNNSDSTGLDSTAEAGQSASLTDPANFINHCTGKTLTNGLQVKGGSCNGVVMGDIPASTSMISAIIVNPKPGDVLPANQNITFQVQVLNLVAGSFTNPTATYYAAPQTLQGGKVVGHTHFTVQDIGSIDTTTPPDPSVFSFFKGVNDAGNGNGLLSATAAGGLPAGTYRVCTMTSASNHQPVLMPVAQRGAQDDCTKFTVSDNAGAAANSASGANTANAASSAAPAASSSAASAASAASSAAASANTGANANKGTTAGKTGQAFRGGQTFRGTKGAKLARRFASRPFIA